VFIRARARHPADAIALYASSDIMYPNADLCRWKSLGRPGEGCCIEFDSHDFKYGRPDCFIAVEVLPSSYAATLPNAPATSANVAYSLTVDVVLEDELLSPELQNNYRQFKRLFQGTDGARTSQSERKRCDLNNCKSFTYGEISFVTFSNLLDICRPQKGEIFFDLGSGAGKGVFAANYIGQFSKCIGIEFLGGLFKSATETLDKYKADSTLWKSPEMFDKGAEPISFVNADMTEYDWWSTADIVFTSSICFEDSLFIPLTNRFERMKPGARVITLKMPNFSTDCFDTIERGWFKFSWGRCTTYILKHK